MTNNIKGNYSLSIPRGRLFTEGEEREIREDLV
jgi:hypothetical protein